MNVTDLTRSQQSVGLFVSLLVAFGAAAIGGVASLRAADFYQQLIRPRWAPPGRAFGPVWSILYLLMGIASWLVWREHATLQIVALTVYVVQLAANALWTWLFFAWRKGRLAFVEILVLWALIVTTVTLFWQVRPLAALLLLPYLAWVSFASFLAFSIWRLNPRLLGAQRESPSN